MTSIITSPIILCIAGLIVLLLVLYPNTIQFVLGSLHAFAETYNDVYKEGDENAEQVGADTDADGKSKEQKKSK